MPSEKQQQRRDQPHRREDLGHSTGGAHSCKHANSPRFTAVATSNLIQALDRRYRTYFANRAPITFTVRSTVGPAPAREHIFGPGEPAFTITIRDGRGGAALASRDQLQIAMG